MMNDEQRMDDLLAQSAAHSIALRELSALLLNENAEKRLEVRERACAVFEALATSPNSSDRASYFCQRGLAELEQIFRDPPK